MIEDQVKIQSIENMADPIDSMNSSFTNCAELVDFIEDQEDWELVDSENKQNSNQLNMEDVFCDGDCLKSMLN